MPSEPSRQDLDRIMSEVHQAANQRLSDYHAAAITPTTVYENQVREELLHAGSWMLNMARTFKQIGDEKTAEVFQRGLGEIVSCLWASDKWRDHDQPPVPDPHEGKTIVAPPDQDAEDEDEEDIPFSKRHLVDFTQELPQQLREWGYADAGDALEDYLTDCAQEALRGGETS